MYETHFALRLRPFLAAPDSAAYYPATGHERALERLHDCLRHQDGLALLTASPGLGKTLLCHCLVDRLGAGTTTAFLTNSHTGGRAGLLQALLFDLGLPYEGRHEQELRLALTDFLLRNYAEGRRAVLVVDEAHHLAPDLLEELRLLGNLEARRGKAVQVILTGQPGLLDTLRLPELAALNQRLASRLTLEPLGLEESADYLVHQLRLAGARPAKIVPDEALELLARAGRGVPRLLNQAAHLAFVLAHEAGAPQVDVEAVLEALARLGLDVADDPGDGPTHGPKLAHPASEDADEEAGTIPMAPPEELRAAPRLTAWTR